MFASANAAVAPTRTIRHAHPIWDEPEPGPQRPEVSGSVDDRVQAPALALDHVSKVYRMGDQSIRALDEVSFEVRRGEYVALTGVSGSGKSTALQLMGLLDRPTSGDIRIDGRSTSKLNDAQQARFRGKRIGFVFQYFQLYPTLTALENVALPMNVLGVPKRARLERAMELLEIVGLGDRPKHLPHELSGGQRQRVAIARALINEPAVLLADEPTGNLDSATTEEILDLFEDVHARGTTLIIVTHEHELAERADRRIQLLDGKVVAS